MIPDDFKNRVRENTDLVALVQRDGVALKKVGGVEWRGLCPFHKESTPSFTVNESKGFFHCFGCAEHGDAFDWVMRQRNVDFMEALKQLAHAAGLVVPGGSAGFEKKMYRPPIAQEPAAQGAGDRLQVRKRGLATEKFRPVTPGSDVWRYLTEKRKLPESVLGEYRLCETHSKDAFYQDREDWQAVGFAYGDPAQPQKDGRARIEFIKCLNLEREKSVKEDGTVKWAKTEWRNPDSRRSILFGMDAVPVVVRNLVICEGEMDALSWRAFGHWAVSVPSGAKSMGWIDLCTPWLERFERIYLSFDEDAAGRSVVTELAQRMGIERASIVRMPEDAARPAIRYKDANECLQAGVSPEVMTACLHDAEVITPERLRGIYDFEQEIWEKFHATGREQLGYVLPWGNSHGSSLPFRFRLGEVTVWSGHNGHGKSQVLNHILVDMAWQGLRSIVCSFEMAAPETYRRLIRMVRAEAKPADCTREEFRARCLTPLADKVWVYDHVGMGELNDVLDIALYARRRYNVRVVVIDSLMCLKVQSDEDKYNEQKNFMNALTAFASQNQMHVILVAHSKKLDVKGNKEHHIPRKYDVAGSADISNLAWNVCIIWRNKKKEERLREMWDDCARRAGKSSYAMTAVDFDQNYTMEEKDEIQQLLSDKDAYFLVDKQRGGEGDEMGRDLWFHKGSLQYLEQPYHKGARPQAYWKTKVAVDESEEMDRAGGEPTYETTEGQL